MNDQRISSKQAAACGVMRCVVVVDASRWGVAATVDAGSAGLPRHGRGAANILFAAAF